MAPTRTDNARRSRLTPGHCAVLTYLARHNDPAMIGDLAEATGRPLLTTSVDVHYLQRSGYLTGPRRAVALPAIAEMVDLTDDGLELAETLAATGL